MYDTFYIWLGRRMLLRGFVIELTVMAFMPQATSWNDGTGGWIINENGVCQCTAFSAKQLTLSQVISMILMQFAKQIAKKPNHQQKYIIRIKLLSRFG